MIFFSRNLHHCMDMSVRAGLSKSKVKPWHRRRHRTKQQWPPLGARRRRRKKSQEKDSRQDFSFIDLTQDESPAECNTRHENNQPTSDTSGFLDKRENCRGLEGTRRVLKFESSFSSVPVKSQKSLTRKTVEEKTCTRHEDLTKNRKSSSRFDQAVTDAGTYGFRTPTDLSDDQDRIVRKSRPSITRGTQRSSFRSMLTALKQTRNQIIKESHS